MKRIIYEKKYESKIEDLELHDIPLPLKSMMPKTGKEFLESIEKNSVYLPCQERIEKSKQFIETVMRITELYEFDVKIITEPHSVRAEIILPDMIFSRYSKEDYLTLLSAADEIAQFTKDSQTKLILDYYTSELYFKEKKMHHIS